MALNEQNLKELGKMMNEPSLNRPKWCYVDSNENLKVSPALLGKEILKENAFMLIYIKNSETLYQYDDEKGCWFIRPLNFIKNIIHDKLDSINRWSASLERNTFQYVTSGIQHKSLDETFNAPAKMVFNFKNGVFDWNTMGIVPHDKDYFFTSSADYDLDTSLKPTPESNKYFAKFFGENAQTMKEAIGYCFYPSYAPIQEIVILRGNGHDGKSPFLNNYLVSLLGLDNISGVSLSDLGSNNDNNFKLSELFRKYANFSIELTDSRGTFLNTATLKMLTGGDYHSSSVKNKSDLRFKNFAKLFIATNELISFRDNSGGFKRRIFIIDVHKIKDFEETINYQKLMDERGAFVYNCIQLAKKAFKRKDLTKTESIEKNADTWFIDNDPIQQFIDECFIVDENERTKQDDVFNSYKNWCVENGYKPLNKAKFKTQLKDKGFKFEEHRLGTGKNRYYERTFSGFTLNSNANPISKRDYPTKITKYYGRP